MAVEADACQSFPYCQSGFPMAIGTLSTLFAYQRCYAQCWGAAKQITEMGIMHELAKFKFHLSGRHDPSGGLLNGFRHRVLHRSL